MTDWVRVASKGDVAEGTCIGVRVGEKEVAIYHMPDGDFCATENVCSHEFALLTEGWMENGCIECPLHAAQFDIRTGKALSAPRSIQPSTASITTSSRQKGYSMRGCRLKRQ